MTKSFEEYEGEEMAKISKEPFDKKKHLPIYCLKKMDEVRMPHGLTREFIQNGNWSAALSAIDEEKKKYQDYIKRLGAMRIAIKNVMDLWDDNEAETHFNHGGRPR